MQIILLRREAGLNCVGTSNAEILNILPARAVQHSIEAVQGFYIGHQLYPLFAADLRLLKSANDIRVQRVLRNDVFSPLCRFDVRELRDCGFSPSFACASDGVGAAINEFVGARHHAEYILVHDDIWPEKVHQSEKIIIAGL